MKIASDKFVDTTAVDATSTYSIPFEQTSSAAIYAKWTKTAVTGSIIAQWSANEDDWVDIGSSANLATAAIYSATVENKGYLFLRLLVTIGSGELDTLQAWFNAKG